MAEEIVAFSGGISVREPDGRFQPVKTPSGFTDSAFRNAVAAADLAYRTNGQLPSVDDCYRVWPRIPKKTYAALFLSEEFKQALRYRGVEWDSNAGLSLEQGMALLKLTDPSDRRTTGVKLKELGIPMPKYEAWMRQPLFAESYAKRTEALFAGAVPMALNKIVANAEMGDMRAIELILNITGRWNPSAQSVEDARAVVMKVIEAVIKHVPDSSVRAAIMADVSLYAGTLQALEG